MSDTFDLAGLTRACKPGGASVLTVTTELVPAAGPEAGVAPARYVRGRDATYAFETRMELIDGVATPVTAVVLASKQASINYVEASISQAITDDVEPLNQTPRITLTYEGLPTVADYDLPHRAFDGHIRAGMIGQEAVTANAAYRAARDSTAANAKALLELSPTSIVLGSWDSTRRSHQVRFRSALVGETIGILSDQTPKGREVDARGGARFDTIAPSVRLTGAEMEQLVAAQESELSPTNVANFRKEIAKAKGPISAAGLGLGAIPPSLSGLGFVSCRRIIRSNVLSFAALRQVRFGLGPDGDAAARALLAAYALSGLTRAYQELCYRANCDLREAARPVALLDARYGDVTELDWPSVEAMDDVLTQAIEAARRAGVRWEGQALDVTGNPLVAGGIEADADEGL